MTIKPIFMATMIAMLAGPATPILAGSKDSKDWTSRSEEMHHEREIEREGCEADKKERRESCRSEREEAKHHREIERERMKEECKKKDDSEMIAKRKKWGRRSANPCYSGIDHGAGRETGRRLTQYQAIKAMAYLTGLGEGDCLFRR